MAVNISLFDNYRLKSYTYGWTIVREDNGREFVEGYYTTMASAIEGFIQLKLRGFDSTSLLGLKESMKQLSTRLNEVLQGANLRVVEEKQ